jgi:precorrin-3B methylase
MHHPMGSLVVVGSGIKALHQLTAEARGWIAAADKVLYAVCEPFSEAWIKRVAPEAEDLCEAYAEGKDRRTSYAEMVERILGYVRLGFRVCAVFYGHPGVFVHPSFEAIQIARAEGHAAFMLPGISAEDCLYADLGVDPAMHGCLSYEATEFLTGEHDLDPTCAVILWQVDCVGVLTYEPRGYDNSHAPRLVEALLKYYPPDHVVYLFTAPMLVIGQPKIVPVALASLADAMSTTRTSGTLYIPPAVPVTIDMAMAARLGIADELNG